MVFRGFNICVCHFIVATLAASLSPLATLIGTALDMVQEMGESKWGKGKKKQQQQWLNSK